MTFPILEWSTAGTEERERVLTRGGHAGLIGGDEGFRAAIGSIIERVRHEGDKALVDLLRQHDHVEVSADRLKIDATEVSEARGRVSGDLLDAIRTSIRQSRSFNERVRDHASWLTESGGVTWGQTAAPIPNVGLFVPTGKGSYPSVAIQVATPAIVAGVGRIAVMIPPLPEGDGSVDPATLVVLDELGIEEIYRSNGPAGIGALALGTESIRKVDKIVGPGSPGITLAQMIVQQFGTVVEVGFGPSDSAIIADDSADPELLAADLLNEAEHGPDSSAILIGTDRLILDRARAHIDTQLQVLPEPRRGYATTAIANNGGLIQATDTEQAVAIVNEYAPEHLQLAVAAPEQFLDQVRHAGTVLLGQWTTFAMSNFATGTPATLPTTGFAKVSSGVTADTYLTRTAVAGINEAEFWRLAPTVEALASHEGFPAHVATVTVRRR